MYNPLKQTAVLIFLPKMYRLFISSSIKHELSRAFSKFAERNIRFREAMFT